ncbi:hypothetical protein [Marinicrinis sediminis]|uniref:Uncharacterized protein n=1 Tax=Marinicrinis sediminis TaxID=1652465 RepID=A0ABW5RBH7_9BACL
MSKSTIYMIVISILFLVTTFVFGYLYLQERKEEKEWMARSMTNFISHVESASATADSILERKADPQFVHTLNLLRLLYQMESIMESTPHMYNGNYYIRDMIRTVQDAISRNGYDEDLIQKLTVIHANLNKWIVLFEQEEQIDMQTFNDIFTSVINLTDPE